MSLTIKMKIQTIKDVKLFIKIKSPTRIILPSQSRALFIHCNAFCKHCILCTYITQSWFITSSWHKLDYFSLKKYFTGHQWRCPQLRFISIPHQGLIWIASQMLVGVVVLGISSKLQGPTGLVYVPPIQPIWSGNICMLKNNDAMSVSLTHSALHR
jgi:hypothetical protein